MAFQFPIPPGTPTDKCESCGAEIHWIKPGQKNMPVNPDGTSHYATCPDASFWRGKSRAEARAALPPEVTTPVSDPEIQNLLGMLRERPNGLNRDTLTATFAGNNRRARHVVNHVVTQGIAPIVSAPDPLKPGNPNARVYRMAENEDEALTEAASLRRRAAQIMARADGLERAWYHPRPAQKGLFNE